VVVIPKRTSDTTGDCWSNNKLGRKVGRGIFHSVSGNAAALSALAEIVPALAAAVTLVIH
jgi:hypothetical protein